ncbi:prenyltransferase [Elusimicrobiota bacterium]
MMRKRGMMKNDEVIKEKESAVHLISSSHHHLIFLLRYRFFLFAGGLPYLLGAACAYYKYGTFNLKYFLIGLLGIVLSVAGVEIFNEFFDTLYGTDRVFSPGPRGSAKFFLLIIGMISFFLAFLVGVYLTINLGWPVMAFAAVGFMAAAFYEGPPIRWVYIGLGETIIFMAYGPAMTMGSFYLHAQRTDLLAGTASLVPGLLVWAVAIANAIPDFYQDTLVGKRNLVVRFGKKAGCYLYNGAILVSFALIFAGALAGQFPKVSLLGLLSLPIAIYGLKIAFKTFNEPKKFVSAARAAVLTYSVTVALFTLSFILPCVF